MIGEVKGALEGGSSHLLPRGCVRLSQTREQLDYHPCCQIVAVALRCRTDSSFYSSSVFTDMEDEKTDTQRKETNCPKISHWGLNNPPTVRGQDSLWPRLQKSLQTCLWCKIASSQFCFLHFSSQPTMCYLSWHWLIHNGHKTTLWKAATVIFVTRESHARLPHDCEEVFLSCYHILSLSESVRVGLSGTESTSAALRINLIFAHPLAFVFMPIII